MMSVAGGEAVPVPGVFGRYRVERVLDRGGMGSVYRAFDTELQRPVALKVPHFAGGADSEGIARFQREARLAAALSHPKLCPVFDVGRVGDVPYLTMPLLDGEPLAVRLRRERRLDPRTAAGIARDVAGGLAAAHRAGVVHRDLKPGNVMLTDTGPVVMDFGLARRRVSEEPRLTAEGAVLGTPAYLAPEQLATGEPPGPAADIYALGVLLYEMITGRIPFDGELASVLWQIQSREPTPVEQLAPAVDPRLAAAVRRAMAKSPSARFGSMEEFGAELEACLRPDAVDRSDSRSEAFTPETRPVPTPTAPAAATRVLPPPPSATLGPGRTLTAAPLPPAPAKPSPALIGLSAGAVFGIAVVLWAVLSGADRSDPPPAPNPPSQRPAETPAPAPPPHAAPPAAADPFPVGSRWAGTFRFREPLDFSGDVRVAVTERTGETFRGTYATEGGKYEWRIAGTLRGRQIRWTFPEAVRPDPGGEVVRLAHVEGTLYGGVLEVRFLIPSKNETADMRLTRQP